MLRARRRARLESSTTRIIRARLAAPEKGGPDSALRLTDHQTLFQAPPDLHAYGVLLVPAFAAVIVLTLMAGWSNDPELDEPGAHPGYGHDLGDAGAQPFSSGWPAGPDQTAAPAPPAPGPADQPHG